MPSSGLCCWGRRRNNEDGILHPLLPDDERQAINELLQFFRTCKLMYETPDCVISASKEVQIEMTDENCLKKMIIVVFRIHTREWTSFLRSQSCAYLYSIKGTVNSFFVSDSGHLV